MHKLQKTQGGSPSEQYTSKELTDRDYTVVLLQDLNRTMVKHFFYEGLDPSDLKAQPVCLCREFDHIVYGYRTGINQPPFTIVYWRPVPEAS